MVPGRVCKQQEHLLRGKRLITGLMKPENTSHVSTNAAVAVPELGNHWQGLWTAFLCCAVTKALGLWNKIKILPFSKMGKAPVPTHCCSPSISSHLCWYHSPTSTHGCDPHNYPLWKWKVFQRHLGGTGWITSLPHQILMTSKCRRLMNFRILIPELFSLLCCWRSLDVLEERPLTKVE